MSDETASVDDTQVVDTQVGDRRVRACNHCETGTLWRIEERGALVCDTCHAYHEAQERKSKADRQRVRRERRQSYDDRDEYEHSGRARLFGGYERAYYSWVTDREYAIDQYDEVTENLWTPHNRAWSRG